MGSLHADVSAARIRHKELVITIHCLNRVVKEGKEGAEVELYLLSPIPPQRFDTFWRL